MSDDATHSRTGPPAPVQYLTPAQQMPGSPDGAWMVDDGEPEIHVMEYVNLVWAHRWLVLAVVVVTMLLAGAWAFTRPNLYRATTMIALEQSPQIIRNQLSSGPTWWEMERYLQDQVQVLRTYRLARRVADRLGLDSHPEVGGGDSAYVIMGSLEVKPVKETDIIDVSMVGRDPAAIAEWLNIYIQEFIAANIEDNLERTRQVYEVIQSKLDPLRQELTDSEEHLTRFKEREDALLFADQDKNVISEQVNTLTTEYAQAKAERIQLETTINALARLRSEDVSAAGFSEVLHDETVGTLRRQWNGLEVELGEKLRTYKEGHPVIRDLRSRQEGVATRLQEQVQVIVTGLRTDFEIARGRERSLFANIQQLRDESIELSKQTMEYERLKREYDQNKAFLEDMMARSKEADISSTVAINNIRVIDHARPPGGPFSPNVRRTLMMAVMLGLFLGVGLVFGLDYLDQTLRTPEQVERYLGVEALCAVPKSSEQNARVMLESYQSLRTAMLLAARDESSQVLIVGSATPGEGKTTIAYNLGKIMAKGGARVLVIDADLRKPRIHKVLQVKNLRGLTSMVLGERERADVIHAHAEVPNLDLITSGPLPPNPPELFGKSSFKAMLAEARQLYDWIIFDSPPVASVTDALICSRHADMFLLVVEYGGAKRKVIQNCIRQLRRAGTRIPGVVLNKVDVEHDHYYYSYYYSYYHYAYGDDSATPKKKHRGAG